MKTKVDVTWTAGMQFETEINGQTIAIDPGTENGGTGDGVRPNLLCWLHLLGAQEWMWFLF